MTLPDTPLPTGILLNSRRRIPVIWIVPLVAILVGVGLLAQAIWAKGPEVSLQFASAEGLEAGKTRVKFNGVQIGMVTSIALNPSLNAVQVTVQMEKQAESLLVEDSRFWVVRPRIAAGGVSGLATVLSGAYIALDPGKSETERHAFVGLEVPPLVTTASPGRSFVLHAEDLGSLDIGVPVYFRRIQVGRVVSYEMRKGGKGVDVRIFVDAPYDTFVTAESRFWHASGVDVSVGASGVKVDFQSLLSLAVGGVAFASPDLAEDEIPVPAAADSPFVLHADRAAAERIPDTRMQKYVFVFRESVRGLEIGAPVDFRGLLAGEVSNIELSFDRDNADFSMLVEIKLYPDRLARRAKVPAGQTSEKMLRVILDRMVAKGFRGQLRTANVLSGQRYIALDFFPKSGKANVDWSGRIPVLPVQPGTFDSLQDRLLLIVDSLGHTLEHVDQLMVRLDKEVAPELVTTLGEARKTLAGAERFLQSSDRVMAVDSPLQLEMRETLREVGQAASAVRNLADLLERRPESLLSGRKGN